MKLPISRLSLLFASLVSTLVLAQTPDYDYLPQSEVEAITVGEQTQQVLVRPWQGKHQFGAAILLGDLGAHADPSGIIAFLRRQLNPKGWATIGIQAPGGVVQPNHITDANEISKPGEKQLSHKGNKLLPKYTEQAWKSLREEQKRHLAQTMSQLDALGQGYPGKRILIASQQSAGLLIDMLANGGIASPDILVIINPYLQQESENQGLPQALAKLTIPVLDIQSPDADPASLATSDQRRVMSPLNQPLRYEQQRLALNLDQPTAWQEVLTLVDGFARRINKASP